MEMKGGTTVDDASVVRSAARPGKDVRVHAHLPTNRGIPTIHPQIFLSFSQLDTYVIHIHNFL